MLDCFVCTVLLHNDKLSSVHHYAPAKPNAPDTLVGRTNGRSTQDAKSLMGSCPALVCLGLLVEVSRSLSDICTLGSTSGWVIGLSQRPLPDNAQHSQQTDIHSPGRIWTHNHSKWAAMGIGVLNIYQSEKRCLQNLLGIMWDKFYAPVHFSVSLTLWSNVVIPTHTLIPHSKGPAIWLNNSLQNVQQRRPRLETCCSTTLSSV